MKGVIATLVTYQETHLSMTLERLALMGNEPLNPAIGRCADCQSRFDILA